MGGWFRRRFPRAAKVTLHVNDAGFDDWPVVADYPELTTAMAFCQQLREAGFAAELTSDWPLDQWQQGDIALRVHPDEDQWAARDLIDIAPETELDEDEEFDDWLKS